MVLHTRVSEWRAVPPEFRAAAVGALVGVGLWFEPRLVGGGEVLNESVLRASPAVEPC